MVGLPRCRHDAGPELAGDHAGDRDPRDGSRGLRIQRRTGVVHDAYSLAENPSPPQRAQSCIHAGSVLDASKAFEFIGGYDDSLHYSENSDLGFRALSRIDQAHRSVATTMAVLVDVEDTFDGRSNQYNLQRRFSSAQRVIAYNSAHFTQHPHTGANYHAVAGVSALRLGKRRAACRHLRAAIRLNPRKPRWWANAVLAHLGILRRRSPGASAGDRCRETHGRRSADVGDPALS